MASSRIVIIGGGFAGVKCAKTLRKSLPRDKYEIVIFNRENHMVFHPLLAEVAGASINPEAVAAPLRQMLPHVSCRTEAVQRIDLDRNYIEYESHDGQMRQLTYDHVVIACGGAVNLGMVPGMADHAFPLKTFGDAIALRAHVMQQLEKAEVCDEAARKRWYLSFIVIGGGYSGVEAAGEINDLVRRSRHFFQNNENMSSFCCVVDAQQFLQGIVTRTDLFRASELGAHRHTVVRDFMVAPISVTKNDSSLMAAATLRDHELKSLPVIESQDNRRLVGYVRAEKMFMRVLQKLPVGQ